ncbi:MAG: glucose 1-dehydrogenase [Solirubrobacterales bacterium]|nr:glucose 1-dehydrogenase [Solirubrobacterales bacterium]
MSEELTGRRGIVTGGGGGIGLGVARAMIEAGARVALLDREGDGLQRGVEELGDRAIAVTADVTDPAQVGAAVERVRSELGGLDFVVNCAGVRYEASFLDHDLDMWRKTLDVNVIGSFLCSQAAARVMLEAGGGKIVNIASFAGELALRNRVAYCASKAAVIGLTKATALELAEHGINCNAIAPGVTETPLTAHYFQDEERRAAVVSNIPSGHWAMPPDIAGPIVFLCSAAADYVHGVTLFVDGGWVAGKGY